jgi:hypothetical protein
MTVKSLKSSETTRENLIVVSIIEGSQKEAKSRWKYKSEIKFNN